KRLVRSECGVELVGKIATDQRQFPSFVERVQSQARINKCIMPLIGEGTVRRGEEITAAVARVHCRTDSQIATDRLLESCAAGQGPIGRPRQRSSGQILRHASKWRGRCESRATGLGRLSGEWRGIFKS